MSVYLRAHRSIAEIVRLWGMAVVICSGSYLVPMPVSELAAGRGIAADALSSEMTTSSSTWWGRELGQAPSRGPPNLNHSLKLVRLESALIAFRQGTSYRVTETLCS